MGFSQKVGDTCEVPARVATTLLVPVATGLPLLSRTVSDWGVIPAYAASLDATLGAGAMPRLEAVAAANMARFNEDARRLYRNFMAVAGQ